MLGTWQGSTRLLPTPADGLFSGWTGVGMILESHSCQPQRQGVQLEQLVGTLRLLCPGGLRRRPRLSHRATPVSTEGASPGGRGVGSAQELVSGLLLTGQLLELQEQAPWGFPRSRAPFPQAWGSGPRAGRAPGQGLGSSGSWGGPEPRPGCGAGLVLLLPSGSCPPAGRDAHA